MSFVVSINEFEGPLDLMLHLIREKKMDLFNLDIYYLTQQYLSYLAQMEELQLEIASEYLTEIASLIEYKSKKLLPKDESDLEGEYEEDQRDRLVQRLIEYQRIKDVTEQLEARFQERTLQYGKPMEPVAMDFMKDFDIHDLDGTPYDLVKAMTKCLRRLALNAPLHTKVTHKEISVEDRIIQLKVQFGHYKGTFEFSRLIENSPDIHVAIVSFLAVLDLIRQNLLLFTIDKEETIWLKWGAVNG